MVKHSRLLPLLLKMQLRNIKRNIAQFLAIIVIGAIAVTLFSGLQANADVFQKQIDTAFVNGSIPDLYVTTQKYDENDAKQIEDMLPDDYQFDKRLYIPSKIGTHSVYTVIVDSMPSLAKPYEIVKTSSSTTDDYFSYLDSAWELTDKASSYQRYELDGEFTLSIDTSSFELGDNVSQLDNPNLYKPGGKNILENGNLSLNMKVTGFMNHPENVTKSSYNAAVVIISYSMFQNSINELLSENFTDFGKSLITIYLERYFGRGFLSKKELNYFNQYLIKSSGKEFDKDYVEKIRNYFDGKETNNLLLLTTKEEMPYYMTVNSDYSQARAFTYVFPMVFFFVAILVILTTLSQMIIKDRIQIGTLKALGLKRREILFNYLALTSILVLVGTIIGLIIGPLLVPNILGQKYQILYSLPSRTYQFPVVFSLLTALVFLLLASFVTYIVASKELKLKPVDSMRPLVPKIKKHKPRKKSHKNVFALSCKMAFRNLRLDKFRSIMVNIGILGCTALLVCGFGIEDTINYGINSDHSIFLKSDIVVTMNESKSAEELKNTLMTIDGVDRVEPYKNTEMTYYKEGGGQVTKTLYVLSREDTSIGLDIPSDGIVLSEKIATTIQCKVGDEITIGSGQKQRKVKVSLIFKAFYYNCGILSYDNPILEEADKSYNCAWVNVKDQSKETEIADTIKNSVKNVSSSVSTDTFNAQIKNTMSGVLKMTNAIKIFAILLAIVTLYNLALLTYRQRFRDMSTLKVLGFRKREIALSILVESMTLTAVGVILGCILGYPFMLLVLNTNIVEIVQYLFHINALTYVYAILLTFLVAFIINLYFGYHTRKIKMVESLKAVD